MRTSRVIITALCCWLIALAMTSLDAQSGNGWRIRQGTTDFYVGTAAAPFTDNAATLGTTARRWSTIYGVNADFSGALATTGQVSGGPAATATNCTSAPNFAILGDLDTGMGSSAADSLCWAVGGNSRLTLNSTGTLTAANGFSATSTSGFLLVTSRGVLTGGGVDGAMDLKDSTSAFNAGLRVAYIIEANTAAKAPTALENNEVYTNTGDADGSTVTLLNDPTVGSVFWVDVTVAQTITIAASAGETLKFGGSTCGTSLTSNTIGSSVGIRASTGGSGAQWTTFTSTGTWTCNP